MFKDLVHKLNIGVYVPPHTTEENLKSLLKKLGFDAHFAIHKIFIYLDGCQNSHVETSTQFQLISSTQTKGNAYYFNHLIRSSGADGVLFVNASKGINPIPLLSGMTQLNKTSSGFVTATHLTANYGRGSFNFLRKKTPEATFQLTHLDEGFVFIHKRICANLKIITSSANNSFNLVHEPHGWVEAIEKDLKNWRDEHPNKLPLVSCILPTFARPKLLNQAISYFKEQDYPNKELIIVFNQKEDLPVDIRLSGNIKFVQTNSPSIGAKRNEACQQANGLIIAQWDDDDLYSSNRLSEQVAPLLKESVHISALTNIPFFGLNDWSFWKCSIALHKKLFAKNVAGGTLVFLKSIWEMMGQYPNTSLREDADFMQTSINKGAVMKPIDGSDLFAYLRHNSNSWNFATGKYVTQTDWIRCEEFELVAKNRFFYKQLQRQTEAQKKPLVSCIMPTANREKYLHGAIQQFLNQDFKEKELVILDDGERPVKHLIPKDDQIKYHRFDKRMRLGEKRNLGCKYAKADVIMHWDDDDFYASNWISYQYAILQSKGADVCGLSKVYFYHLDDNQAWKYEYPKDEKSWVAGATMAYAKNYWKHHPFPNINVGEDNVFVWAAGAKVYAHHYFDGFVARIHDKNTSPKKTHSSRWEEVSPYFINNTAALQSLEKPPLDEAI